MPDVVLSGPTVIGANEALDLIVAGLGTKYLGILYGDPNSSGDGMPVQSDGTGFQEVDSGTTNYQRVSVSMATLFGGSAANGAMTNTATVNFGTADSDWVADPNRAIALGVFDADEGQAGGDVCELVIKLNTPLNEILTNNTVSFAIGSLTLTLAANEVATVA